MPIITRRQFIHSATTATCASLLLCGTKSSGTVMGANGRLRVAIAGLNGRGQAHMHGFLKQKGVEIAYLIDPDSRVLGRSLNALEKQVDGRFGTKGVGDVRVALDDKDVDCLTIATPNHWHALMAIWGAQAGKHVYVEKPMSHDIVEGRLVVAAQEKYGVVIQHGASNRSNSKLAGLHEAIRARKFGKLKVAYGYCCKPRGSIGFRDPSRPPSYLDWNLWRGPAMIEQFHSNLVHYNWHWFWATGNGDINNQGAHQLDIARWAIDEDQTHPVRVMAIGGRFQWDDQGQTPNTMFGIAEFPNGQSVFMNVRNVDYNGYEQQVENEYYFEDGGKIIHDKYYAKGSTVGEHIDLPGGRITPGGYWGSFVAAVRANAPSMANGNATDAHYSSTLGHLINNSYRLGEKVPFDKKAGQFLANPDAYNHFAKLHGIMSKCVGPLENENEYVVGPWLTFDPDIEIFIGENATEANALLKDPNRSGFEVPSVSTM